MTKRLSQLGWNTWFENNFEPYRAEGFVPARVAVEHRGQYVVLAADGDFSAEVAGRLLYMADDPADLPKVGDWVAVTLFEAEKKAIIHHVLPRRTKFSRQVAGKKVEEQIVAANIDCIFVVQSADQNFNPRRLERYLLLVREGGADAAIILNKVDVCSDLPAKISQAAAVAGDIPIIPLSAATGEGVDQSLREKLQPAHTYALVGSSGVGKSTLLNRLAGQELLKTTAVRTGDSKGRHTTTHRELVVLPGGALLIDSPGMREVQVWSHSETLEDSFADITTLAAACRFPDCSHTHEKGCSVLSAINSGQLDPERYKSYIKLNRENKYLKIKQHEQARRQARRDEKSIHRSMKKYRKNFDPKR